MEQQSKQQNVKLCEEVIFNPWRKHKLQTSDYSYSLQQQSET
jgi:hypothetical protein